MKKTLTMIALAASALGAQAQLVYDTTGIYLDPINANDVPGSIFGDSGLLDALITTALPGKLTVTFLGKEAGHTNQFKIGDLIILNTAPVGTSGMVDVANGALKFSFKDQNDGSAVDNGGNLPTTEHGSYVIFGEKAVEGWVPLTTYNGMKFDLIIGFNDGAKVDADYDDHVLGLTLAPIPEPGTYALMLAGLAAVGFVARRRRAV